MPARLLWADPDREFTYIGRRYFEASGIEVVTTSNARECVQQLKYSQPDVLVVDDEIPFGGLERVLYWVQEHVRSIDEPVIIVSSDLSPAALTVRLDLPRACCLHKPYRLLTIVELIADSLSRHHAASVESCMSIAGADA